MVRLDGEEEERAEVRELGAKERSSGRAGGDEGVPSESASRRIS